MAIKFGRKKREKEPISQEIEQYIDELEKAEVQKPRLKDKAAPESSPELEKEETQKLKSKDETTSETSPKKSVSLDELPCAQRELISDGEKYQCRSRMARNHGLLGNAKEAFEKCSHCHVRESPT